MPLYGILKKYLGEWLDLFVIIFILTLYYYGLLKKQVLFSSLEILVLFYLYKIYHIIFVRQFDKSKRYLFSWDTDRMFTDKFLTDYRWPIYILFILMPWNLFWYILVTIVVKNKLLKVWFNGSKDIFFFALFKYDIRSIFERYIIWYYDNIDKYVKIFINQPFLRMIILPTLIRNSLIHSSFLSILRARMFMFLFVSILVFTGLIEYLHQPLYIWIIIIYIYYLLIWPIIIKIFNIEYFDYILYKNKGVSMSYATPSTVFAAYLIAADSSVSLKSLTCFLIRIKYSNMIYFYNGIFPRWYNNMLSMEILNKEGLYDYVNVDRKFSAIMFWRYEKIYTSFICFKIINSSYCINRSLTYYCALSQGFYGGHIKQEEVEKMKEFLKLYIDTCVFFSYSAVLFLNPKLRPYVWLYLFYRDEQVNKIVKNYKDMNCENFTLEFFNIEKLVIEGTDIEILLPTDFGLRRYKSMLRYASFFEIYYKFGYTNVRNLDKFLLWFHTYIENIVTMYQEENKEYIVFSDNWLTLHRSIVEFKYFKHGIYQHEIDWLESLWTEYEKLYKQEGMDRLIKWEDIDKLLKFK